jgi:hypothetical protein
VNAFRHRLYWARGTQSDHISLLNAFNAWYNKMPNDYQTDGSKTRRKRRTKFRRDRFDLLHTRQPEEIQWCTDHGLNYKGWGHII